MIRIATSAIVVCPGCDEPMKPVDEKPVLSTANLSEVIYVCARCQMTTARLISSDAVGYSSDE